MEKLNLKKKLLILLDKDINKFFYYSSYVKTLYEALNKGALKSFIAGDLYSSQILSKEEIQELEENKKNRIQDLPISTIFSKSFISFSKNESVAEYFLKKYNKNVMLILEEPKRKIIKKSQIPLNADIKELSEFPN